LATAETECQASRSIRYRFEDCRSGSPDVPAHAFTRSTPLGDQLRCPRGEIDGEPVHSRVKTAKHQLVASDAPSSDREALGAPGVDLSPAHVVCPRTDLLDPMVPQRATEVQGPVAG